MPYALGVDVGEDGEAVHGVLLRVGVDAVKNAKRKASPEAEKLSRKRGWMGSENVLRSELRMYADWIASNAPRVTLDEFLGRIADLFRKLAKRDRHLAYEPGSTRTKTRRPDSPLCLAVQKALGKLTTASGTYNGADADTTVAVLPPSLTALVFRRLVPRMQPLDMVLFQQGNVTVTTTRAIIGNTTYPINTMSAIAFHTIPGIPGIPGNRTAGVVLLIVGSLLAAFGVYGGFTRAGSSGALFDGGALLIVFWGVVIAAPGAYIVANVRNTPDTPPTYVVKVHTAGLQTDMIVSEDRALVEAVVSALNEAVIQRG